MNPFDDEDDSLNPFNVDVKQETSRINGLTKPAGALQQSTTVLSPEDIESHWRQLDEITTNGIADPFDVVDIKKHLSAMGRLVAEERPHSSGRTGDCLEFLLSEDVIEKVYALSLRERTYSKDLRLCILNFFVELLSSPQPLLIHQQVLRPLTKLLHALEENKDEEITAALVPVLHQICVIIHDNPSLLDLFYMDGRKSSQSKCLIFALLITHIHEADNNITGSLLNDHDSRSVASCSRDAILSFLALARKIQHKRLAAFITDDTSFCPVLATSLSAMYSELPTVQPLACDEWSSVTECVRHSVSSLSSFIDCLHFCNAVIQVSPDEVVERILSLINDGFLQHVIGPALFQKSEQALVFSTAYLNILLSNVTAPQFMRVVLQFLITGYHDNDPLLDALIGRVECVSDLCSVSLELLYSLVDLNCEDVMLELILKLVLIMHEHYKVFSLVHSLIAHLKEFLRYLLHANHVKPSHIQQIGSPDVYGQFATKVISLRPIVCIAAENLYLEKVVYNPVTDYPDGNTIGGSWFKKKSPPSNLLSSNVIDIAYISMESSYFIELRNARKAIETCARACKCWSNCYNSCTVSKDNKEAVSASTSNHSNIYNHSNIRRCETTISRPVGHKKKGHSSTGVQLNYKAGVFIKVLLEKLSRLLAHTPKVNLLLTKLISRLCHYPHPLLTSFLLNHSVTLLQAVPDLPLILSHLSAEISEMEHREEGLELRIARARKTMIARASEDLCPPQVPPPATSSPPPPTTPVRPQNDDGTISLTDLSKPTGDPTSTPEKETGFSHNVTTSPLANPRPDNSGTPSTGEQQTPKRKQKKVATTKLYSIVIFDEFLKELAAISQEQSIVSPVLYSPNDDGDDDDDVR